MDILIPTQADTERPPDTPPPVVQRLRLGQRIHDAPAPTASPGRTRDRTLMVRDRLDLLLDKGSFTEIEPLRRHRASAFGMQDRRPYTDGVVTGWGTIDDRTVFVYAQDSRIFGGSLGEAHAAKIHKTMDLAESAGAPLISLNDSGGARIQEGVDALAGYGGIFVRNARLSGTIPQVSVLLGPCAGGAAYSPALTDFVLMVRGITQTFVTGPDVVATVTGERVSTEELGGAEVHATRSGLATVVYDDETACLDDVRYLLSLLPSNNRELPPYVATDDPPDRRNRVMYDLVPADPHQPYDMRAVVTELVDDGDTFELHEDWATNIICALARLGGHVVGLVANQPTRLAGVLDIDASQKAARFVQLCDAFNIPLVTLVDVPGFLPGVAQEHNGIIRHGAKLLYAYCAATVPRIQLILRKAYGGAYIVMDSRSVGADLSFAWPSNEIAVMGAEAAVNVIFRREIANSSDPAGTRARHLAEYRRQLASPYHAAEHGLVDDIIDPALTRQTLIRSLEMLRTKHAQLPSRKHGNPPQ